jgi:hypothetical protein
MLVYQLIERSGYEKARKIRARKKDKAKKNNPPKFSDVITGWNGNMFAGSHSSTFLKR